MYSITKRMNITHSRSTETRSTMPGAGSECRYHVTCLMLYKFNITMNQDNRSRGCLLGLASTNILTGQGQVPRPPEPLLRPPDDDSLFLLPHLEAPFFFHFFLFIYTFRDFIVFVVYLWEIFSELGICLS